jgi:predicted LPLAT superfamily acyltransferase
MLTDLNIFRQFLFALTNDHRITVWHTAISLGIIQLAGSNKPQNPILISRKKLMALTHIGSIATYHKCLKELHEYGYIDYLPSYHPGIKSRVYIVHQFTGIED